MDQPSIITGKDLERYFDLNQTLIEFNNMFNQEENDRVVAIIGGAFLDTLLEHILTNFLVDDEREVSRLLQYDQSMGTYGSRVSTTYCLGLIGKLIRDDLRTIGKIRNRFAHDLKASFDDDPVRSWCLALQWHKISMLREPPYDATPRNYFQVGVNQLISHLDGIVGLARMERRKIPEHS